jgi:hypothetical protein
MNAHDPKRYEVFTSPDGSYARSKKISSHDEVEGACIAAYSHVCKRCDSGEDDLAQSVYILDWFCTARLFGPYVAAKNRRARFGQFMAFVEKANRWDGWKRATFSRQALQRTISKAPNV